MFNLLRQRPKRKMAAPNTNEALLREALREIGMTRKEEQCWFGPNADPTIVSTLVYTAETPEEALVNLREVLDPHADEAEKCLDRCINVLVTEMEMRCELPRDLLLDVIRMLREAAAEDGYPLTDEIVIIALMALMGKDAVEIAAQAERTGQNVSELSSRFENVVHIPVQKEEVTTGVDVATLREEVTKPATAATTTGVVETGATESVGSLAAWFNSIM